VAAFDRLDSARFRQDPWAVAAKIRKIVLIQGHPDADRPHFAHALADAYAAGAHVSPARPRASSRRCRCQPGSTAGGSIRDRIRRPFMLAGVRPIRQSLIGLVEAPTGDARDRWIRRMRELGAGAK
jgi:hypothetical protein